ncbi:4-oxalocrotonate tautomerase [Cupriavidus sp. WKF15]|uniref:tautomerase family protein n=1 Tax=Cupriavidus sp. WKF15 TaxID=3032282 RepID=UPI0023E0CEB6|nr:4-oxalocrotonate tautomerase [Cupriavidus sp. WKF15]WER50806.1 4-oxalocrotonate tautomerase [Cupriavidus sp. WKF15]
MMRDIHKCGNHLFAKVMFQDVPRDNYFMGSKGLRHDQVFVQGHVRARRTHEQKAELLKRIINDVCQIPKVDKVSVWIYLSELPPGQMVEYGEFLPKPEQESQWMAALDPSVRSFMERVGN